MKNTVFKMTAIAMVAASLALAGCGKKNTGPDADSQNLGAASPAAVAGGGLQGALSQEGQQAAQVAALPHADASVPLSNYVNLESGKQIMYLYYALLGKQVNYDEAATAMSPQYSAESDPFKKRDMLATLKPQIDDGISRSKGWRYFFSKEDANLSHYDLTQKGFNINNGYGSDNYSYFYDVPQYTYSYSNGDGASHFLSIPDENLARKIESMRGSLSLKFYGFMQVSDPDNKRVKAQLVRIDLLDNRGNVLVSQPVQ